MFRFREVSERPVERKFEDCALTKLIKATNRVSSTSYENLDNPIVNNGAAKMWADLESSLPDDSGNFIPSECYQEIPEEIVEDEKMEENNMNDIILVNNDGTSISGEAWPSDMFYHVLLKNIAGAYTAHDGFINTHNHSTETEQCSAIVITADGVCCPLYLHSNCTMNPLSVRGDNRMVYLSTMAKWSFFPIQGDIVASIAEHNRLCMKNKFFSAAQHMIVGYWIPTPVK